MVDHGRPRLIGQSTGDRPNGRWADGPVDRSPDRPVGDFQKVFYFMGGVHIHDEFISNYLLNLTSEGLDGLPEAVFLVCLSRAVGPAPSIFEILGARE